MFQYAFGLAAARRLGTDFAMADDELRAAFTLGRNARLHRRATRAFRYRLGQRQGGYRVVKVAPDTDPAGVVASLADSTHYAGFFQSETYFAGAREEVRQAFTPRGAVEQAFRERYAGLLGTPYVCCHVRRTDYVPPGWALPVGYYEECLRLLEPGDGTPVVFVGDDLVEAERAFGGDDRVRFERNESSSTCSCSCMPERSSRATARLRGGARGSAAPGGPSWRRAAGSGSGAAASCRRT